MSPASERLHGLDAVRGYALMLGVVFHATMSFLPGPQVWVLKDSESSMALSALFFASHTFRMTTFFLIAGFFAHMSFGKKGARAFIRDRALRIALPLVIFWPLVIAGIIGGAVYAIYVATGQIPTSPPPTPAASGAAPALAFPLTHLWFLYALLILYAATLAVRGVVAKLDAGGGFRARVDRVVAGLLGSPLAPLVLALPAAGLFYARPDWLVFFGVPTPDQSLIPNSAAAVQFGLAFGLGWLLHRQMGLLSEMQKRWPLNLAVALALTVALLAQMGVAPVVTPDKPGLLKAFHALAYALAIWTWTFAVIGLALRFLSDHSPARRYIADSSYWIYIVHLPLVIFLQAWLSRLDWPALAKFGVVLAIGFALMFASYELLVRHTFLGRLLNGRRVPWRAPRPAASRMETAR
ncbi:MAG: acyltransferase family protein [Phenylobacterium sp.]|uniref:acyltransferase family protein n=1 Tax=Phenylobacterium sp. TaxID=1871053 RepID=UPI001A391C55|nr:acyltransferase family protein [Phenylobacterium sp.]MBL8553091.1 acyltransferase family protein [Phenylobacterium sp.]